MTVLEKILLDCFIECKVKNIPKNRISAVVTHLYLKIASIDCLIINSAELREFTIDVKKSELDNVKQLYAYKLRLFIIKTCFHTLKEKCHVAEFTNNYIESDYRLRYNEIERLMNFIRTAFVWCKSKQGQLIQTCQLITWETMLLTDLYLKGLIL